MSTSRQAALLRPVVVAVNVTAGVGLLYWIATHGYVPLVVFIPVFLGMIWLARKYT